FHRQDARSGLLWIARGLRDAPRDDAELQQVLRTNLDDAARRFRAPRAILDHEGIPSALAFDHGGKVLATADESGVVQLWDVATAMPSGPPLRHPKPVHALAFSPDGKLLLTGSDDHTARFHEVATGRPVGSPLVQWGPIRALSFGPRGTAVATGSHDG